MSFGRREVRRVFRTIGFRLTLWGAGFALLVCLLVCVVLYAGVSLSLRGEVDSFLRGEMEELTTVLDAYPGNLPEAERVTRRYFGSRARGDLTFRVLDTEGAVLLCSNRNGLRLEQGKSGAFSNGISREPQFETLHAIPDGRPLRICSQPITGPRGATYIAQVAYDLAHVSASLASLRWICLGALALASGFAFVGGWFLARRTLSPLHHMTASARRISMGSSNDRLPRSHTEDELDDLAQTLNDMLDRGERYVRRMQRFTADASHELRSPLAALRGNAEVALTRERSAPEFRAVIEESVEQYDRLIRIAEDLLLLARVDAGEAVFRREPVRLDAAIEDVVDLYGPLASDRGFDLTFDERTEVVVQGDGGRLRQLVGNLIENAIKHTDAPGCIGVRLTRANESARIEVCDTGAGIPSEHLPHLFDRFYRVDRARSANGCGGAGLGLSICRTVAEAHGGRIGISSSLEQGTHVTVTLPQTFETRTPDPARGVRIR